jgi:hypothetical protein
LGHAFDALVQRRESELSRAESKCAELERSARDALQTQQLAAHSKLLEATAEAEARAREKLQHTLALQQATAEQTKLHFQREIETLKHMHERELVPWPPTPPTHPVLFFLCLCDMH